MSESPVPGSWAYGRELDERGQPLVFSKATTELVSELTGACHIVAYVLNERHGWQLRALGRPADSYSFAPWHGLSAGPRHVYCLRDDGRPVDVHGLFADEWAIRRFYGHQHGPGEELVSVSLTAEEIRDELPALGYQPLYERSLAYARTLVGGLGLSSLEAPRPELSPAEAQAESQRTAEIDSHIEALAPER